LNVNYEQIIRERDKMAKKAVVKRGRKPGQKVGPYKMNLTQMAAEIKALKADVAKLKKVLS